MKKYLVSSIQYSAKNTFPHTSYRILDTAYSLPHFNLFCTVSLFLPCALRRLRTRCPVFVDVLERNPCTLRRRRHLILLSIAAGGYRRSYWSVKQKKPDRGDRTKCRIENVECRISRFHMLLITTIILHSTWFGYAHQEFYILHFVYVLPLPPHVRPPRPHRTD